MKYSILKDYFAGYVNNYLLVYLFAHSASQTSVKQNILGLSGGGGVAHKKGGDRFVTCPFDKGLDTCIRDVLGRWFDLPWEAKQCLGLAESLDSEKTGFESQVCHLPTS